MATLFISEYGGPPGGAQVAPEPRLAAQTITIAAGTTTATNPFGPTTRLIRVHTDGICAIKIGKAPITAVIGECRMVAGQTEYFGVSPGDSIAVIQTT